MSDVYRDFLRILDLMTSPMLTQDGYKWVITSIDMLQEGPCAIFTYDWHHLRPGTVGTSSHDSFACTSLRYEGSKFVMRGETCTLGKVSTDAQQALSNRFLKALRAVR